MISERALVTKQQQISRRVEQWRRHVPPEEDIEVVWEVACHYFPESYYKEGGRGSHLYWVQWTASCAIARAQGWPKLVPFEPDGTLLLPTVKGRKVRNIYIRNRLKAIKLKEQYDEILAKKG